MIVPYSNTKDSWKGESNFGKIICIDFDGVIAKFDGWKGPNIFGDPIDGAISSIQTLHELGWYICIFTTRLVTHELVAYLDLHAIPYNDINGRGCPNGNVRYQSYNQWMFYETIHFGNFYWMHNPEFASIKPIASVYLDDCSWENEGKNYAYETWVRVLESLLRRFP